MSRRYGLLPNSFGLIVAMAILAAGMSGCASLGGAGGFVDAAKEVAKDPNCGHTDRINLVLGVVSSGSVFLERNCPMPGQAAPLTAAEIGAMVQAAVAAALRQPREPTIDDLLR